MKQNFIDETLVNFHKQSILNCYLGDMERAETTERQGFYEMEHKEDDWNYRDSFTGFYVSTGQEIIRFKKQPVWFCNYGGGLIEEYWGDKDFFKELESFLQICLREGIDADKFIPRGQDSHNSDDWGYKCNWEGDISNFSGLEEISYKDKVVFSHRFFGGKIIGKNS